MHFEILTTEFLQICAGISCVAAAGGWLYKLYRAAKSPNEKQDERLAVIEARLDAHDKFFERDKNRLDEIEEGNRVTIRALLALLSHGIDGNEVEAMKAAKKELHDYLTK